jgi:catechol 2,3-dioxygenase-like lactoylglutathione lyase family enzyme
MKLSSVSGVVLPVRDPAASQLFYQQLGFHQGREGAGFATVYLNWFWVEFVIGEPIPATSALALKVDDLHEVITDLTERGLGDHLAGECGRNGEGRKGIRVVDPDGYQLELFAA